MVEQKDAVIAIFGASGTFGGLLLVFSGLIFSQAASFPAGTVDGIKRPFVSAAKFAIYAFCGFLLTTLLALAWLLHPNVYIYDASMVLFIALVIVTGVYGVASVRYLGV
jgi:hypothetical protein